MSATATCTCGATWTGLARAHCSSCHQLFAGPTAFDAHRVAGKCDPPSAHGLTKRDDHWAYPAADNPWWSS